MANVLVTQRDTQLERQRAGFVALSLTNFLNDDAPAIAAGAVVEISGSVYEVTTNEAVTGWASVSHGVVWIKLIPSGTDPFTAEFTAVAPTWNDAKQGWYDATGAERYVAGLTKTGASGYAGKRLLDPLGRERSVTIIGQQIIDSGSGSVAVPAGVTKIVGYARGGGGAGGGARANYSEGGAGGGGGAFVRHVFRAIGAITYSVGVGGVGADDTDGTAGGDTTMTVGAETITASGGGGGGRRSTGIGGSGGAMDTNADYSLAGENGENGSTSGTGDTGGTGGASGNDFVLTTVDTYTDSGFSLGLAAGRLRAPVGGASPTTPSGHLYGGGGPGGTNGLTIGSPQAGGHGAGGAVLLQFWGNV